MKKTMKSLLIFAVFVLFFYPSTFHAQDNGNPKANLHSVTYKVTGPAKDIVIPMDDNLYQVGDVVSIAQGVPSNYESYGHPITFEGWTSTLENEPLNYGDTFIMPDQDVVFYDYITFPSDTIIENPDTIYHITYDGGVDALSNTAPVDTKDYRAGDVVTLSMDKPIYESGELDGWIVNGITYQPGDTFVMPQYDVVIKAVYHMLGEPITVVLVVYDGSIFPDGLEKVYHFSKFEDFKILDYTPIAPDGGKFIGYSDGTNLYQPGQVIKNNQSGLHLSAVFEVPFRVTYESNENTMGNSMPMDATEYKVGDLVTISSSIPKVENGLFLGWNIDGKSYKPGDTFVMPSHNVVIYAEYEIVDLGPPIAIITVTYDGSSFANGLGQTIQFESISNYYVTTHIPPTPNGSEFVGYSDGIKLYKPGELLSVEKQEVYMTPVFKIKETDKYSVTYDASEFAVLGSGPVDLNLYQEGDIVTIPAAIPHYESGWFNAWMIDGVSLQPGDTFIMPAHKVTVVADYVLLGDPIHLIGVTYDGSIFPDGLAQYYTYTTTETIRVIDFIPTASGATFMYYTDGVNNYQPGEVLDIKSQQEYEIRISAVFKVDNQIVCGETSITKCSPPTISVIYDKNIFNDGIEQIIYFEGYDPKTVMNYIPKSPVGMRFVGYSDGVNLYQPGDELIPQQSATYHLFAVFEVMEATPIQPEITKPVTPTLDAPNEKIDKISEAIVLPSVQEVSSNDTNKASVSTSDTSNVSIYVAWITLSFLAFAVRYALRKKGSNS